MIIQMNIDNITEYYKYYIKINVPKNHHSYIIYIEVITPQKIRIIA